MTPDYVAVRAHLVHDGCVLFGWNAGRSVWTTFGGKTEPGETAEQTLVRELQEELGITPTSFRRLPDRSQTWDAEPVPVAVFAVDQWIGEPSNLALHEHHRIEWFDAAQIAELPLAEDARREALGLLSTRTPAPGQT